MGQAWLIIERFENWEVDEANKFSFFGLPNRYRHVAGEVARGDLIFSYVSSGRSAFSDMRKVRDDGLKRLKVQSYDTAFAFYFSTEPVVVLPRANWLPIKRIADQLELTRGRKDYRPLLQTSIRKLSTHDAAFLERAMREVAATTPS